MIDLAQCDKTLRTTDKTTGNYTVVHDDNTLLGINLTWQVAYKLVCQTEFFARMIRTN